MSCPRCLADPRSTNFVTSRHLISVYEALAFGADFSSSLSPQFSSFTATLLLDNGETFNFTAPSDPGSQFFGFISPSPIMDLPFSDGGIFMSGWYPLHEELIGNIYMVAQVPEPSSPMLLLLGLPLLVRRKHS